MRHPATLYLRKHGFIRSITQVEDIISEIVDLPIDCVLAQGFGYLTKYYFSLLEEYRKKRPNFDFTNSTYWRRLIERGVGKEAAERRISDFCSLYERIEDTGFVHQQGNPVAVCDVGDLLPYRYYRYNGAHRACIAKVLGLKEIPVLLSTLKFRGSKGR